MTPFEWGGSIHKADSSQQNNPKFTGQASLLQHYLGRQHHHQEVSDSDPAAKEPKRIDDEKAHESAGATAGKTIQTSRVIGMKILKLTIIHLAATRSLALKRRLGREIKMPNIGKLQA